MFVIRPCTIRVLLFGVAICARSLLAEDGLIRRLPPVEISPPFWASSGPFLPGQYTRPQHNPVRPVSFEQYEVESDQDDEPTVRFVTQPQPADLSGDLGSAAITAGVTASGDIALRGLRGQRRSLASNPGTDFLLGSDSRDKPAVDLAGLIGNSSSILGTATQERNPVVHDVRTRGNHVGQLVASGSFWMPARPRTSIGPWSRG